MCVQMCVCVCACTYLFYDYLCTGAYILASVHFTYVNLHRSAEGTRPNKKTTPTEVILCGGGRGWAAALHHTHI